MSVAHQVHSASLESRAAVPARTPVRPPWWQRRAFFRYGFVALILIAWEIIGPFINPIFFSYPSKIAVAFYDLTASGDLPYYLGQSLEVMLYGLGIAVIV